MAQIRSPRTIAGRYCRRCASVPFTRIMSDMSLQRSWASATAAEARASSSWAMHQLTVSAPAPPYSGGTVIPRISSSAIRL